MLGVDSASAEFEREVLRLMRDPAPETSKQVEDMLAPLSWRARRDVLHKVCKQLGFDIKELEAAQSAASDRKESLSRAVDILAGLKEWVRNLPADYRFDKPTAPQLHHLRQALRDKKVVDMYNLHRIWAAAEEFSSLLNNAESFLIEHNWGEAFSKATDFDGGFRLPYDECAFEFRLAGRSVISLAANYSEVTDADNVVVMQVCVAGDHGGWVVLDPWWCRNGVWSGEDGADQNQSFIEAFGKQVKAISVALDAEVAETEVIRVDGKFAKARLKSGKVPPRDYHVVSLAHRHRNARTETAEEPGTKKRLHFRRGHWRHFSNFKTWVRWTLVGDPALGFIDKHYRL